VVAINAIARSSAYRRAAYDRATRPDLPDLVVWDYVPATPLDRGNLWGHVMFGLVNARAAEVLVAGERVLVDGRPVRLDETELRRECVAAAARLWERF
jgi:hypothetical protein